MMRRLILTATLILTASAAYASVPMSIGDKGSIIIPFYNNRGSVDPVEGVNVSALTNVAGVNILETSFLGPVSVFPGCTTYFHVDFEITSGYDFFNKNISITIDLTHSSPKFLPASRKWVYTTQNLFQSLRGECVEPGNIFCGEYLSPDTIPPDTEIVFDGAHYIDNAGKIFVSPLTLLSFIGSDGYLVDSNISAVSLTGYKLDAQAAEFAALTQIGEGESIILPEGPHTLYFASRDHAGNAEEIQWHLVTVDATAPESPIGPKANGASPSPWKHIQEYDLSWTNPSDVSGVAGARVKFGGVQPQSNAEGDIYPADNGSLLYASTEIVNGSNVVWVWLEDSVGNADPATAKSVVLRYDDQLPAASATVAPLNALVPVPISFIVTDAGVPETGSGPQGAAFWYRYDKEGDGVFETGWVSYVYKLELKRGAWGSCGSQTTQTSYSLAGVSGTVNFNAGTGYESGCGTEGYYVLAPGGGKTFLGSGVYEFYIQGRDTAGNVMPAPIANTAPAAQMFFDNSAPAISAITSKALSPSSALVEWTTDDETTAVIDCGRTTSFGGQYAETTIGKTHSVLLTGLPSPASIYFRITATNKTGLSKVSATNSFTTPLDITYTTDIFGVIDYTEPVTLNITNPDITEATFKVDGQTGGGQVTPGAPFVITVNPEITGGGTHDIVVNAGAYEYTSSFVVDNAVRTVKLARLVIDAGGIMSPLPPAQPVLDATLGQAAQEVLSNGESKLSLGYYAGIDPAAPGAIADLAGDAGPNAGQTSLSWTAPGDDGNAGTAMKYEIRYSPEPITAENFSAAQLAANIPKPETAGTRQTLVMSGLENGKTYYFAIKTLDELLNSSLSNVASIKTLEVAQSAELVGDKPVVEVVSAFNDLVITQVPAESQVPAVVVAREAAPAQALAYYSEIYEITPSRTFEDGAQVNFRYTDPGNPDVETGLKVYKFNPTLGEWVSVESVVDAENNIIRAVTYSFSLYAIFGIDHTPPVTTASLTGGVRYADPAGNIFVSGASKLSLTAVDQSSGSIARIEYRLDSAIGPFEKYTAPVYFAPGWRNLQFRSVDKAGNEEAPKSLFLMKDALEPRIELGIEGYFARLPGGVIHVSSTSGGFNVAVMDQPSSGSGLKKVRLELDDVAQDIPDIYSAPLNLGRHTVRVWAEDNVGNISETTAEIVVGDLLPPVVKAPDANFIATESTVAFSWQHQTTNFFSLTEYDLVLGATPGFTEPLFTHAVSSSVSVSIGFGEAGVSIDGLELHDGALRLITEAIPDHLEGTLEGTVATPWIGLPARTTGLTGIWASQELRDGSVGLEFSTDGVNFYLVPADGNISLNYPNGGSVKFRGKLTRAELTDASPIISSIQFTVNYQAPSYYNYCHRHCFMCDYHCHSGYEYTDKSYYTSVSAASSQNTLSGVRISGYWVELITDVYLDKSTGTVTGIWRTSAYEVPELAYRIGDFVSDFDLNEGQVSLEFSKNNDEFRPLQLLASTVVKGGDRIVFRAILSRENPNKISPVLRGINFNFILPPPTGAEFNLPEEGKYYWRAVSKDYLGRYSAPSEERLIIFDTKPPLTEQLLVGSTGQNGWYISPVSAAFVSTDAVAGVAATYYSVGASSFTVYSSPFLLAVEGARFLKYYSTDEAGNAETKKEFTAKIDLSSPSISALLVPAANEYGWNKEAVGVIFVGSDTVSGLDYCTSSVTVSGEGAGLLATGVCFDNAGLSSSAAVSVSIDATAPAIEYTRTPAPNGYGWSSSSVTLGFTCEDALSGVASCPADVTVFSEGLNIPTSAKVFDRAGNSKVLALGGINIDLTQPVSTAALAGTLRNGWYSSPVVVTLTSTDTLSGIRETLYSLDGTATAAYQQPFSVGADGAHLVAYNSVDRAGNSELQKSVSFSVDRTAPQTGYALSPRPNADGWNNTAVNVVFSGTDTLAGVEACSAGVVGANGLNQQLAGWCRDRAGNTGHSTATVSVDLLPPTVRATRVPMPNSDGWNNVPVRVGFSAEDALSGVAFCSADKTIAAEGLNQTVNGTCADKAGNTGAGGAAVSLDFTAPDITYTRTPAPNAAGWNNAEVTLKFACTDSLSGIKSCPADITFGVEGVNISTSAKTFDLAGNSTQTIVSGINIDRTAPVIAVSSPAAGNVFVATKDVIRTFFMARDNLDPAPVIAAFLVQTEDRGSPRGGRAGKIAVANGQAIEPLDIDDGIWRLAVSATDFADNAAYLEGETFEVIHDVLPPASSLSIGGPRFDGPGIIYLTNSAALTLSSLDDLVQPRDGVGLGVRKQVVKIGFEGSASQETVFGNTLPKQGEAFVSTFTLGSVWNLSDGRYNFDFAAEDILGNIENGKHSLLGLDNTPPEAAAALAGIGGENGWNVSTVTVTLTAVDAMSGVEGIFYRLDGAQGDAFARYAGAINVASEGPHTVWYYAKDNLGNTGAQMSAVFKIDLTSPTISLARSPLANANGWNNIDVRAVFTCSDNLSGVKSCPPEVLFAAEGAGLGTSGTAFDLAGNSSVAAITGINIDKTAPESSLAILGDLWQAAGNKYLSRRSRIALTAADPVSGGTASGMEIFEYQIDAGAYETYSSSFTLAEGLRTLGFRAGDRAGNIAIAAPEKFYVDGTGPVSALSVSGDQYHGDRTYVSLRSNIVLGASDPVVYEVASGVKSTKYSVDSGAFGDYSTFKLAAEGKRLVSFYSTDRVGNIEVVKASELWVDATAPVTELSISGARHDDGGLIYITKDSGIVLTAADPVSAETASGVLLTKYRIDGGNWQVYAGSFTITAAGRHTLEFHSLDRVQNTEAVRTAALAVDNTPPATNVTLGEPKFEAFGLPVLTPTTPITLTASDVVAGEVASGLKSISYETVNVASGDSSVHNYTAPFNLPQGTYDLRYWSVDNLGNTEQYKQIRFSVSTFQNDSLQAVDGLDMSGTADISGAVKSNALVGLGGNARILGDVAASTITLTGKAQITGQQFSGQAVLSPESIFLGAIAGSGGNSVPAAYLVDGKLVASSQAELTLTTGTYYLKGIELSGGSKVRIEGQVDIMVAGDISLSGGSSLNTGGTASQLNIFINTPSSITVAGGGELLARVYAPYAHMKLAGNGLLGGHYFVKTAALSGTGNIIQAGETLPQTTAATGDNGGKKRVSAMAAGDASYSVLAGPDPAFRLGEVYVFPNPALRGAAPVLHIETGIADRVKITIYTVSGRQAHEHTLTGLPLALDDGNGLSYAYEYAWRDNIPSGVYYYHIEAEKGGQKIKKSGKFGVVR